MTKPHSLSPLPALLLAAALAGAAPPAAAQRGVSLPVSESADTEPTTLRSLAEIEESLLRQEQDRYRRYISLRRQVNAQLDALYARLDELTSRQGASDLTPEEVAAIQASLNDLETDIRRTEDQQSTLVRDGWVIRERIRDHTIRLAMLRDKWRDSEAPAQVPSRLNLSGQWLARLLPMDIASTWTLRQSGTLLTGTYEMDGGRYGSFTGTLIDRKVTLHQIDSKYGRDMTFYGTVAEDGATIRGNWESLDLSGGKPGFGSWTATRPPRASEPAAAPAPAP